MGPICILVTMGRKGLVIDGDHAHHHSRKNEKSRNFFLSPEGAGPWPNPCDTDTGNDRSLGRLLHLTVSAVAVTMDHAQIV